jgi:hypothetical protein
MTATPIGLLGRTPYRPDSRTLRLANYRKPKLNQIPAQRYWHKSITDWGVMGNDTLGNCVIVTPAHAILVWRANELDDTRRIADAAVIELSRQMGATNGYNILDRLKYWRKESMWSNRLWAFAAIDPDDIVQIKDTINTFGVADIGINLPIAWQGAPEWTTGAGRSYRPGSWGGHSVPLAGYDEDFVYAVSWGKIIPMTWDALPEYCDEAYALIDALWIARDAVTPCGYDLQAIRAELNALQAA